MQRFKLGSLDGWMPVQDRLDTVFEPVGRVTPVSLVVIGRDVDVYATTKAGTFLVASGTGELEVDFSAEGEVIVTVAAESASVRFPRACDVLPASDAESYTSLEPRGQSNQAGREDLYQIAMRNGIKRRAMLAGFLAR